MGTLGYQWAQLCDKEFFGIYVTDLKLLQVTSLWHSPSAAPGLGWNSGSAEVPDKLLVGFTEAALFRCVKRCAGNAVTSRVRHVMTTYPRHTRNRSTCSKSHVVQIFQSNSSGKTQLLASNSSTLKHHKSGYFLLLFGISEWYRICFLKWDTSDGVILTIKLLAANNLTAVI